MKDNLSVIIPGEETDHYLVFRLLSRRFPGKEKEFVRIRVEARAGMFLGLINAYFQSDSLKNLHDALVNFQTSSTGEFTLASKPPGLWASITGDGTDTLVAHCTMEDPKHKHTRFRFDLYFLKSSIPEILQSLEKWYKA